MALRAVLSVDLLAAIDLLLGCVGAPIGDRFNPDTGGQEAEAGHQEDPCPIQR